MHNRIYINAGNYQNGNMAVVGGIITPSGTPGKWSLIVDLWDYETHRESVTVVCDSKGGAIDALDMIVRDYPSKYGMSVVLNDLGA